MSRFKTVYVTGAGFSKDAGAPLQSEIMKEIFLLDVNELDERFRELFNENKRIVTEFLTNTMYYSEKHFDTIALEDIYTPIDRCILDNVSFRNISPMDLIDLRQRINSLIIVLFVHMLENCESKNSYISDFANYLNNIRKSDNKQSPFSIISTNWDIILDNELYKNVKDAGVIDYCCHITPYKAHERLLPALLAKGKGKYNIKILKVHGSMNWLHCQRCQRLYVTFFDKIALDQYLTKPICRLCDRDFSYMGGNDGGASLVSNLIMPTFLKDINNVQLKLVWQNAGIELSSANKIIFMGYSFPMSDFELRQLLSRTVRHNAEIDVVLCEKDKPNKRSKNYENTPEFRYKSFFGKRKIHFYYDGVQAYINEMMAKGNSVETLAQTAVGMDDVE